MDAPTAADIRVWSKVDFDDLEFEAPVDPDGAGPEPTPADSLERIVKRAEAWLQYVVGRSFASVVEPTQGAEETDEEFAERVIEWPWLETSMEQATQMLVEYAVFEAQPDHAETAADFNEIASFTAGSYSEVRRGANARTQRLHPWVDLSDLLNNLMTDAKKILLADGPAIRTDDGRWNVGQNIMGFGDFFMTPFGPFRPPWDALMEEFIV